MEYLRVKLAGREERVPVLVNGEENGFTNEIIQLDDGFIVISAKIDGAETKEIELMDTTPENPMEVEIQCYS